VCVCMCGVYADEYMYIYVEGRLNEKMVGWLVGWYVLLGNEHDANNSHLSDPPRSGSQLTWRAMSTPGYIVHDRRFM
jgi:hypothetical protein